MRVNEGSQFKIVAVEPNNGMNESATSSKIATPHSEKSKALGRLTHLDIKQFWNEHLNAPYCASDSVKTHSVSRQLLKR